MRNDHYRKVMCCPGCDRQFSRYDKVIIKAGLVLCPNCMVELKSISQDKLSESTGFVLKGELI